MFSFIKQKLLSLLDAVKAPYVNFTEAKRESTSKTFQSLAVAAVAGGVMRVFFDADANNNWEVIIWLPCAIIFYHFSILVLPGDEEE